MKVGIHGVLVDTSTITVTEIATAVEERGFESLWIAEHSHMPVATVHPGVKGALPEFYKRLPDPFVLLAAAAAVTSRIRVATHVCLPTMRDPLVLAKEVATLDQLSNGRVTLGVGYGWNDEEMRNHGEDPQHRRAIFLEKVRALKALWTEEEASFEGEHVRFTPSWSYPKPAQRPHPPLIFGVRAGPKNFGDIMAEGDGWLPATLWARDQLPAQLAQFWAAADAAGRPRRELEVSLTDSMLCLVDRPHEEFAARCQTPKAVEDFAATGVARLVVGAPFFNRDRTLAALDELAPLVDVAESL